MNRSYACFSVLSFFLAACGAENALVGGECAEGYTFTNNQCVRSAPTPATKPFAADIPTQTAVPPAATNDGPSTKPSGTSSSGSASSSGGASSSSGGASSGGASSSSGGASSGGASSSSGGISSGAVGTSSSGGESSSSGGASSSGATESSSGGSSSGGSSSGDTTSSSGGSSSGGVIVVVPPDPSGIVCEPGFASCNDGCVRTDRDARNCGACGRICASNVCIDGECQGETPGDIVVIGHDMSYAPQYSTLAKVFMNSVHLPHADPLRVLAFEDEAGKDVVDITRSLTASGLGNRSLLLAHAGPTAFEDPALYASWDVILVDGIASANAASYGNRWGSALSTFTKKGGVLVALDNGDGDIPGFFASAQLMALGAHVAFDAPTTFLVSAPGDTVGNQLLSPYAAFGKSVGYSGVSASSSDFVWVVRSNTETSLPTVIHQIAR